MSMSTNGEAGKRAIELRKYPNRRYYDVSHSRYVTLRDIHQSIVDGNDVRITDARTDEDITTRVLAQIILEQDPPKLQIFPVELLHQLIRANEALVHGFVQSFFGNALVLFMESQRLFDRYLRMGLGRSNDEWEAKPAPLNQADAVSGMETGLPFSEDANVRHSSGAADLSTIDKESP